MKLIEFKPDLSKVIDKVNEETKVIPISIVFPRNIIEFTCEAFYSNGTSLGFLTYLEFLNLRSQIQDKKLEGFYMIYGKEKIYLDSKGNPDYFPNGFYDQHEILLRKLVGI